MVPEEEDPSALENEIGGHRHQRVPPTEKRGRIHTSTVTVAVLGAADSFGGDGAATSIYQRRSESDFEIQWFSGSGAGGQNRNRVLESARVRHIPTGTVRTAQTRSRENSLKLAMASLTAELDRMAVDATDRAENGIRKIQVGSGQRGDKIRTYRWQDDRVTDGRTGKTASCRKVMLGHFDLLWA